MQLLSCTLKAALSSCREAAGAAGAGAAGAGAGGAPPRRLTADSLPALLLQLLGPAVPLELTCALQGCAEEEGEEEGGQQHWQLGAVAQSFSVEALYAAVGAAPTRS